MRRVGMWGVAGCVLWLAWGVAAPAADEETETEQPATVVRTSEGLHFTVPPDWPIERRDGKVGPIPIEEYLAQKFGAMDRRFLTLEQKVGALESKVSALELQVKKKALQSSEGAVP